MTRRHVRPGAAVALAITLLAPAAFACPNPPQPELPVSPLVIDAPGGPARFAVELADSPTEQNCGLMRRQELAANEGMLFDYRPSRNVTMWMENTPLPLDMLFFDAEGELIGYYENARPFSRALIPAGDVGAVLEVRAGTVERLALKPGVQAHHGIFGSAPGDLPGK